LSKRLGGGSPGAVWRRAQREQHPPVQKLTAQQTRQRQIPASLNDGDRRLRLIHRVESPQMTVHQDLGSEVGRPPHRLHGQGGERKVPAPRTLKLHRGRQPQVRFVDGV
jgi:hypothetical protein